MPALTSTTMFVPWSVMATCWIRTWIFAASIGQIVFNNRTITVPANRSYFQTRVAMTDQGTNIVVDVSAGIDLNERPRHSGHLMRLI